MDHDLKAFKELKRDFPGKIRMLRYEDLSNDPYQTTTSLLSDIGLDYHYLIKNFLDSSSEIEGQSTVSRKSKNHLLHWTTCSFSLERNYESAGNLCRCYEKFWIFKT